MSPAATTVELEISHARTGDLGLWAVPLGRSEAHYFLPGALSCLCGVYPAGVTTPVVRSAKPGNRGLIISPYSPACKKANERRWLEMYPRSR